MEISKKFKGKMRLPKLMKIVFSIHSLACSKYKRLLESFPSDTFILFTSTSSSKGLSGEQKYLEAVLWIY